MMDEHDYKYPFEDIGRLTAFVFAKADLQSAGEKLAKDINEASLEEIFSQGGSLLEFIRTVDSFKIAAARYNEENDNRIKELESQLAECRDSAEHVR